MSPAEESEPAGEQGARCSSAPHTQSARGKGLLSVRRPGKAGKRGLLSHKQKRRKAVALEKARTVLPPLRGFNRTTNVQQSKGLP